MPTNVEQLTQSAVAEIEAAQMLTDLSATETKFLGRNKGLNELRRLTGTLPQEERPAFGAKINDAVQMLTALVEAKKTTFRAIELKAKLQEEAIDITLPGRPMRSGKLHPLTQTSERVKRVLCGMGFEFVDGPELEDYQYNFDTLNYPEDHPAMDEQSSFFVTDTKLLRTQTTALQGRMMAEHRPPFRFATIGRCFRYEAIDATHHHTFHQVDVFMVDENLSMADLKGTLGTFARAMFGETTRVRFRPDFFPFVEPGVDYAISTPGLLGGRWLELGGAGMIHPNILRAHGISTEKYSGFAFGLGVERIHMIGSGVDDLRLYLENDLRFLKQF